MAVTRHLHTILLLLLLTATLTQTLSLGHKDLAGLGLDLSLTSGQGEQEGLVKRGDGRRMTRDRYRMGYMFGKRSNDQPGQASIFINTLTG